LQCVAVNKTPLMIACESLLKVCVLQCVAVCVLQCVAVNKTPDSCNSQCVAVRVCVNLHIFIVSLVVNHLNPLKSVCACIYASACRSV